MDGEPDEKDKPFCFETKLVCYITASILLLRDEGPRFFTQINMLFSQNMNPFLHDLLTLSPVGSSRWGHVLALLTCNKMKIRTDILKPSGKVC